MENNELARRELGGQSFIERLIEKTDSLEDVKNVGMVIINSGFCPQHFRDSKDAVGAIMCIEAGRKLGLSWMQSLSDIYPVKGRIGIMGTAAKAVIFASGILESWEEFTEGEYPQPGYKHITVSKRKDLPNEFRTEFSVFDASTAGLMQKEIYKKYGKRMIAWRDIGFHASDYYQDVLKGMKTVEELNDYDGLVPGTPEKITLKTEDGKELIFTDKDKEHSQKSTSRVANKIPDNKFGTGKENIQEATVVDEKKEETPPVNTGEESPFIPQKGSAEAFAGEQVDRDIQPESPSEDGRLTLDGMEKMDTEVLKKMVMEDMDMMEAAELVPGKNTNKKLREIIFAHQEGALEEYVAPYKKEDEANAEEIKSGGIPPNKDFDKGKEDAKIDAFLSKEPLIKADEVKAGNKYDIAVSETVPRDFSEVKVLFNKMMGITPQITTPRYMELSDKLEMSLRYPDKEKFCKEATVEEINQLLNAN